MRNLQQPDGRYAFAVLVLGPLTLSENLTTVNFWNECIIDFSLLLNNSHLNHGIKYVVLLVDLGI